RNVELERPDPSRTGNSHSVESDWASGDPRDAFVRDLDLPRGHQRERIQLHARTYELHGGEIRVLATAGTFRVVPEADLRGAPGARPRDVRHLQELGLVRTVPYVIGKTRTKLVTLTERGRDVLEDARRRPDRESGQAFYAGIAKPRELAHDAHLYRAYTKSADRLVDRGARIR